MSDKLAVNMQKLMQDRGWNCSILAERAGLSYQTVRRGLLGQDLQERTWVKIAAGLGVAFPVLCGQVVIESVLLDDDSRAVLVLYDGLTEARRALVHGLLRELSNLPVEPDLTDIESSPDPEKEV
jgi:hypothetical protein